MGKKDYLTHVREGTPLRGQEQAVTCGESKQEPLKAGLLPTAEIFVPLAGKSAHKGPCPLPPFLCRQFSHHSPCSPAKCCLCSLGSKSCWWAGYCFPHLVSSLLLYLLCPSGPGLVESRNQKTFLKPVMRNFLALKGAMGRVFKDHLHLRDLTGSLRHGFTAAEPT